MQIRSLVGKGLIYVFIGFRVADFKFRYYIFFILLPVPISLFTEFDHAWSTELKCFTYSHFFTWVQGGLFIVNSFFQTYLFQYIIIYKLLVLQKYCAGMFLFAVREIFKERDKSNMVH